MTRVYGLYYKVLVFSLVQLIENSYPLHNMKNAMQKTILIFLLFSLFLSACAPQAGAPSTAQPALTLFDCVLPVPSGQQITAKCATLDVPEDRTLPQGRRIPLNIVVIPAVKRKPAPDPLFLLAGGPGQSAVEAYPALLQALYSIHENRDLVLVDQRGTGKSNPLRCLDPADESLSEAQVTERMISCPARLDADVRFYTTEIAMQDLDDVRAALGYQSLNLYGASYGTRAAQTYLRMFPARVRTITLDAVVDPKFVMFVDAAGDGQKALEYFFTRCAADAACGKTFPSLRAEFDELLQRLDKAPVEITIPHPVTNQPLTVTLTRRMLTSLVFSTLYSPDMVATLPLSMHAAATQADYAPLISQAYMLDAGLYEGMFYAVTCSEDAPQISPAEAERLSADSVFGNRTIEFANICKSWPKGAVSQQFRAGLVSDVPALILSGQADPITPTWHADTLKGSFSNALFLEYKGMGHGNLGNRCTVKMFKTFLDTASVEGLDTGCVTDVQPPPFFVDFSGPRP